MYNYNKVPDLNERNCAECNKIIFPTPKWVYKINKQYYCSYKCWRKNGGDKYEIRFKKE